jgi:SAM-dependent methyltransferase
MDDLERIWRTGLARVRPLAATRHHLGGGVSSTESHLALPELRPAKERPGVYFGDLTGPDPHFYAELRRLMDAGEKRFCDIGGGGSPVVGLRGVEKRGLDYVVFDASQIQLDRTPPGYQLFLGDALDPGSVSRFTGQHGTFDVVVSRFTAEHMSDGRRFHEHVFSILRPGGTAVHVFPTLYSAPFVLNRLLSQDLSKAIHDRAFPGSRNKFPAYYSWCRGPTTHQLRQLESIGYSIERYVGFFGHTFYKRFRPLDRVHKASARMLLNHPLPSLTSFALAVLVRPA